MGALSPVLIPPPRCRTAQRQESDTPVPSVAREEKVSWFIINYHLLTAYYRLGIVLSILDPLTQIMLHESYNHHFASEEIKKWGV